MRIMIFLRDDLVEVLKDLAWRDNRWPKQQAEWILQQALERAAQERPPRTEDPDVSEH